MNKFIALIWLFVSVAAQADGFDCYRAHQPGWPMMAIEIITEPDKDKWVVIRVHMNGGATYKGSARQSGTTWHADLYGGESHSYFIQILADGTGTFTVFETAGSDGSNHEHITCTRQRS